MTNRKSNILSNTKKTLKRPAGKKIVIAGNKDWIFFIFLLLILIYTSILYFKSLNNGFNWDDKKYLIENNFIKDLSFNGVKEIFKSFYFGNYHPLTTLSWMGEYWLWGISPVATHVNNLILHLLNIVLVFFFMVRITKDRIISLLASFFFAIHPLHVESVAWSSERKDVLYAFFFLLSMVFYLNYLDKEFRFKYIALTFLMFLLSLLSKSMAVTLPVVLILIDIYKERNPLTVKNIVEKLPFYVLSLVFIIVTLRTQNDGILNLSGTYSNVNRFFLISYGLSFYFIEFFFPYGLSAIHPFPKVNVNLLPMEYYLSILVILAVAFIIFRFANGRKYLIFGSAFFIVTVLPVLQLVPFGLAIVSERYAYIPFLGLWIIALCWLKENNVFYSKLKYFSLVIIGGFSIYYSIMTIERGKVWKNGISLWCDVIEKNPSYYLGYYKLAGAYEDDKDYGKQIENYTRCIKLKPEFYSAYNDRGYAKCKSGDISGGIEDFTSAIRINPGYSEAYNNRGMMRNNTGDTLGAIDDFFKSAKSDPKNAEPLNNLGWVYFSKNRIGEAISEYKTAISLNPGFLIAYKNLAWAYFNLKDYQEAINYYSIALKISNNDGQAFIYRGLSYANINDISDACKDWQRANDLGYVGAGEYLGKYCR